MLPYRIFGGYLFLGIAPKPAKISTLKVYFSIFLWNGLSMTCYVIKAYVGPKNKCKFPIWKKHLRLIYVFTENVPIGTAELGYVTIGYLRRCCKFRNYSNPIDFDLVKHLLVTKVSYHWNLFEEIQILNLIWANTGSNILIRKKMWTG